MKTQYSFMLFFLCLNITATLVMELQIPPAMGGGMEREAVEELANQTGAEQVATGWNPGAMESFWGNIVSSFNLIKDGVTGIFFGFPKFLLMIGTPEPIVWAIGTLISFVFGWFLLEFITGRGVSD